MFRPGKLEVLALLLVCTMIAAAPVAQYAGVNTGTAGVSDEDVNTTVLPTTANAPAGQDVVPFGMNMFTGGFAGGQRTELNPDYIITPGDTLDLRVWGATEIDAALVVDPKGNIFVQKVGPVSVGGVRNADLNDRVTSAIRKVYTDNVQVYTALRASQPIGVFVTGFVRKPGRFSGVASNSVLHFIDKAEGIDPLKGSFRKVELLRQGEKIAEIDLYRFLLAGKLPQIQLKDGDTILVGPRGDFVSVIGRVRNPAVFETTAGAISGRELLDLARPEVDATHGIWAKIRDGVRRASYKTLAELQSSTFVAGDNLELIDDTVRDVMTVGVEGAYEGQSRFVVPRDMRLGDLLDRIAVPEAEAAYQSISVRRKSILEQQQKTIEESLQRLEAAYLRGSSQSNEEASIRTVEAKLISDFVARARQVEPTGRLVIGDASKAKYVRLQDEDVISIPERSDSIMVSGEVLIPQAILFEKGRTFDEYLAQAGGFTELADPDKVLLIRQSGEVVLADYSAPTPGDQYLVLPKIPNKYLQFAKEIVDVVYKVAVSAGVLVSVN